MQIVRIFVPGNTEDGIWSVQFVNESQNEFDKFFDLMHDVEWLYDFFEKNKDDLNSGFFRNITTEKAVLLTLEEAQEMEDILYDYVEQGVLIEGNNNLQHIFKPLNNFEYAIITYQKSKARIHKGWLRLYAIRLAENCYLVTGGGIKLTKDMQREHLQNELVKLEKVKTFLRDNDIYYPQDLNSSLNE